VAFSVIGHAIEDRFSSLYDFYVCICKVYCPSLNVNLGPAVWTSHLHRYKMLGISVQQSLMIIGISGTLSIVYCTVGLWLLDSVGRVKSLILNAGGCALAFVVNAALSQHLEGAGPNHLRAMVAMNFIFSLFYTPVGIISWSIQQKSSQSTSEPKETSSLLSGTGHSIWFSLRSLLEH
jgi:hypothetical protein